MVKIEDEDLDGRTEAGEVREALGRLQAISIEVSEELDAYQDRHATQMRQRPADGKRRRAVGAHSGRLDMMCDDMAGENPTPLERLLAEQIVSCWLWVTLFSALMSPSSAATSRTARIAPHPPISGTWSSSRRAHTAACSPPYRRSPECVSSKRTLQGYSSTLR